MRSSEAAGELSQFVARLVSEQVQANVEMLQALARARTWREALEAQTEFFRGNIERMTSGTRPVRRDGRAADDRSGRCWPRQGEEGGLRSANSRG